MFDQGVQNFDFDNYINGNNNTIDNNVDIKRAEVALKRAINRLSSVPDPIYTKSYLLNSILSLFI